MVKITSKVILARVTKGAEYLDGFMPKWPSKINTENFDIASNENCILGQLAKTNDYCDALKKIKLSSDYDTCVEYGFMCDYINDKFETIHQKHWLDAINSRLEKVAPKKKKSLAASITQKIESTKKRYAKKLAAKK